MGNIGPVLVLVLVTCYFFFQSPQFDPESIRNQRVLVTGASAGIGEQMAYRYAQLGAQLVITARRENLLHKVASKCKELGANRVELVAANMALPEDRDRVIKFTEKHLRGLDYLILNHATLRKARWTGNRENLTVLQEDMEVNFVSYVDLASKAIGMLSASKGHIGVVSSGCGKMSCALMTHYSASKFALHGFFSSWRQELNFKSTKVSITICVLGLIDTENAPEMDSSMASSAQDYAEAIIEGVTSRTYEMHYPKLALFFEYVHKLFPELIENYGGRQMLQANELG